MSMDHAGLKRDTGFTPASLNKGPSRFRLRLLRQWGLQLMVIPGVLWMLIFNYLPMGGIVMAFKNFRLSYKSIFQGAWLGFNNFSEFFKDDYFFITMANTLGISLLRLLIGFPLPILFALLLNELRNMRFKKIVQTVSYLPHFLSWVVLGGIMITWLSKSGVINDVLVSLGLLKEPVSFLGKPSFFWGLALISDTWKELGWSAIIYLAAIASVDQEMYEAATVDGASRFKKMWFITLPAIKGTIMILFILAVSGVLNSNFDQMLILKNPLNAERATVLDIYVYEMGMGKGRFGYATAIGLFKSVIGTMLLLSANAFSRRVQGRSLF
jgi:putative aldouronate transport system permease protein